MNPDGGVIADYFGPVDDPWALSRRLADTSGVIEHGLFPPTLVTDLTSARGTHVEMREIGNSDRSAA